MSVSEERIREIVREEIAAASASQSSVFRGRRVDVVGDGGDGIPDGIHLVSDHLDELEGGVSVANVDVGVVDGEDSRSESVHNPIVGGAS